METKTAGDSSGLEHPEQLQFGLGRFLLVPVAFALLFAGIRWWGFAGGVGAAVFAGALCVPASAFSALSRVAYVPAFFILLGWINPDIWNGWCGTPGAMWGLLTLQYGGLVGAFFLAAMVKRCRDAAIRFFLVMAVLAVFPFVAAWVVSVLPDELPVGRV